MYFIHINCRTYLPPVIPLGYYVIFCDRLTSLKYFRTLEMGPGFTPGAAKDKR